MMVWFLLVRTIRAFTCKSGIHSSPAVSDNYVIFGSDDGRLYCLDKLNGNLIWNFSPGYTIDDKINYLTTPIISDPIIDGETVFIGVNGNIYALSL
jgi:outer membrane protein assembly factor BamB